MGQDGKRLQPETFVSLAVFAWNEEEGISATLNSLFEQSLFAELRARDLRCEILCVVNGSTDRTAEVAAALFETQQALHPEREAFSCRVINLEERGKLNAWNQFVHRLSAREAKYLCMMDADILFVGQGTLWKMVEALETDTRAHISVDRPVKDIAGKGKKNFREQLSLGAAEMTQASPAQLCAQLYCIRSEIARNIYLPKDLSACEDGFIKWIVCTDFLTDELKPERLCVAKGAKHLFEAYTSPTAILRNQKRQIIGQTVVHILIDKYLNTLPRSKRLRLAETLQEKERLDPPWLKRLISEHLSGVDSFWKLYPGLLTHRLKGFRRLRGLKRLACLPAAIASMFVTSISCVMAYRFLKAGCTDYWPPARRIGLAPMQAPQGLVLSSTPRNHE